MAHIRTYNPSVRVGNWFEDIQLEEDTLKDFLHRKENGQLLIQKVGKLVSGVESAGQSESGILTVSTSGQLQFGDHVQLVNPGACDLLVRSGRAQERPPAALSIGIGESMLQATDNCGMPDPSPCTAANNANPCLRNVFTVVSCDGTPCGQPVLFNQPFQLATSENLGEVMYLMSDRATFGNAAKKSRHQPVNFTKTSSFQTQWKAEYFNPQLRLEFEYSPIPVNERVIIKHVKTNQSLALEEGCYIKSLVGAEVEVSTNTYYDDHKAERDVNHWVFKTKIMEGAAAAENA